MNMRLCFFVFSQGGKRGGGEGTEGVCLFVSVHVLVLDPKRDLEIINLVAV